MPVADSVAPGEHCASARFFFRQHNESTVMGRVQRGSKKKIHGALHRLGKYLMHSNEAIEHKPHVKTQSLTTVKLNYIEFIKKGQEILECYNAR